MTESLTYDIMSNMFLAVLIASAPILVVALAVGLFIAFFQALTQIQEMTLTFVPKILAIFASLIIFLPFMLTTISEFTVRLADKIIAIN